MQPEKKVNILIVDDRPDGLMALEAILQRPQYNLVKAQSGEEALARILDHDFALILMDAMMPGMDGFETASLIKQRDKSKDIPIIFLTAVSKETHYVRRGYEQGAVDYILKPYDPVILTSKVAVFVDLYLKNKQINEHAEILRQSEVRERARQLSMLQLESLNRYRHLADAIPHIIWKFQSDGTLEYCNRLWMDYSGLSLEQSTGLGWQSAVDKEDLASLLALWDSVRETGETIETECRLKRASDDSYRWHMFKGVPDRLTTGEIGSWIVTNTDIEDRKKIEADLIRAKEDSFAANEAKSSFLANMSHEIRTPLGIVLGYAELLASPDISEAERSNCLYTLKKNGELLSRLIGDVLDLSKIEAGHLKIEKVKFSLPDFLCNATQSFQHRADEKGILLSMIIETPIPTFIDSDPTKLRQILFNIVDNAVKFTEKGEVIINVKMQSTTVGEESLQISVTDQGLGITPEQANTLFQPFIQIDNSNTRKYGGTGLGLSLSRKLARQLGGDVVLGKSQPRQGSTFIITVCTGSLEGVEFVKTLELTDPKAVKPIRSSDRLAGIKVLLVEDSQENQLLLSRFLTMAGAQVKVADNGAEGVSKALSEAFDVVLMDIQMPVLDGYQATRKLRKESYSKPILALTAHALNEERDRCLAAGCNSHLTKPVDRETLLKQVAEYSHLH